MSKLICLGIESTAHTFGIGIADSEGNILADDRSAYKAPEGMGIIPSNAANHHKQVADMIFVNILCEAGLDMDKIDFIAYSAGPGLAPCLLEGANFAIKLSKEYKKPLVPVNHCVSHIEIGKLKTGSNDPVVLYLSGGNTQVIAFTEGRYRIFGETQDLPVGNAMDTLARKIGLQQPYGPNFDLVASKGKYLKLPYVVKGMDLSFSGMLTEAIKKFENSASKEDICHSFQETCFAMITEVTERALAHTDKSEVLMVGGVAASKRMQEMIEIMCKERGAKMFVVPSEYAGDNGSMIGWTGMLSYKYEKIKKIIEKINPKWRTDEVDIPWLKQ
jgi:N6-L-threonylcarbamoyladenine synthase/protein kinase Bud32